MKYDCKISIIIPIYNSEKYLNHCIDSVLNQTYKNLEILLVNDGSTDTSDIICQRFASMDNRIVYIKKSNEGVSSARNCGLEKVTGEFIGFVDSDDIIEKDMFEKLLATAINHKADIVECGHNLVDLKNRIKPFPLNHEIIEGSLNCVTNYLLSKNTRNFVCNKLYNKDVINGLRFSKLAYSEDFVFNVKSFNNCNKKIVIEDILYNYVITSTSATQQAFNLKRLDQIKATEEVLSLNYKYEWGLDSNIAKYGLVNIISIYNYLLISNLLDKKDIKDYLNEKYQKYYSILKRRGLISNWKYKIIFIIHLFDFKFNIPVGYYFFKKWDRIKGAIK